ncbi:uncharacterized protein LOC131679967 [Topomyia yanbarensis]|uniref:uncharacterized protein LOC131679967 n=1 Tax=Topomyia yanbarensis TaxID=2498891 RepID=UPI00273CE645|nr:uncharacterized protein LOC131679967 [Topomyia yanbarensis]
MKNIQYYTYLFQMLVEGTLKRQVHGKKNNAKKKPKLFSRFWKGEDVEYSRLNKSNNNFIDRINNSDPQKPGSEIQLQCLDAHSLLLVSKDNNTRRNGYHDLNTDITSTPGSSIDLEWENDYGYQNNPWTLRQNDDRQLPNYPNQTDAVFKVEEWSTLKKSKDRINSIRRLDRTGAGRVPDGAISHSIGSVEPNGSGVTRTPSICGSYASSSHISTPEDSLEWDIDQDRQLKSENESIDLETKELLMEIEQLKNRVLNETGANIRDLKFDESIS